MTIRSRTRRGGKGKGGVPTADRDGFVSTASGAEESPVHLPTVLTGRPLVGQDRNDIVPTFMAGLHSCSDVDSMCDLIRAATDRMGIGKFHYILLANSRERADLALNLEISTISRDWLSYYHETGLAKYDVWAHIAASRRVPTIWSDVSKMVDFDEGQRRLKSEATAAGVYDGVSIPVRGRTGRAVMSFATLTNEKGEAEFIRRRLPVLSVIAGLMHTHTGEMSIGGRGLLDARSLSLSPRQTEVLQWAAVGKTDWEIAAILNISEKAVKFHFAAARQKLEASNRTHAVAKALSYGVIEPV